MNNISILAKNMNIKESQIEAVLKLLEEGATIPFIARYRKEATGSLDEEQIRQIEKEYTYLQNLLNEEGIITHFRENKQHEQYNYLYHNHVELGKSISQIAQENNVSYDTIHSNLRKNNIEIIIDPITTNKIKNGLNDRFI